jgi:hypothetical protein
MQSARCTRNLTTPCVHNVNWRGCSTWDVPYGTDMCCAVLQYVYNSSRILCLHTATAILHGSLLNSWCTCTQHSYVQQTKSCAWPSGESSPPWPYMPELTNLWHARRFCSYLKFTAGPRGYIYIYIYSVCVCVCVRGAKRESVCTCTCGSNNLPILWRIISESIKIVNDYHNYSWCCDSK